MNIRLNCDAQHSTSFYCDRLQRIYTLFSQSTTVKYSIKYNRRYTEKLHQCQSIN